MRQLGLPVPKCPKAPAAMKQGAFGFWAIAAALLGALSIYLGTSLAAIWPARIIAIIAFGLGVSFINRGEAGCSSNLSIGLAIWGFLYTFL